VPPFIETLYIRELFLQTLSQLIDMKKLLISVLLLVFGFSYSSAQRVNKPLTQEQRMVQSNAKHKNGKSNTDLAKKVKQAKKQDRKARKIKSSNNRRTPKRK